MILTEKSIRGIKPKSLEQKITDNVIPELSLFVAAALENGTKSWRLQISPSNVKEELVLGQYPAVSLRAARKESRRLLNSIKNDTNSYTTCFETSKRVFKPLNKNDVLMSSKNKEKLSKFVNSTKNTRSKFKANPIFERNLEKSSEKTFLDSRRLKEKEEARIKLESDRKIEMEQRKLWHQYKKTQNPRILADFLRSDVLIKRPLSSEMGQEIANLLDSIMYQSDEIIGADDDRIFMTYWRHTEFKNGVDPVVIDFEAVQECVKFMNAVGRPKSPESVSYRITEHYSDWRNLNSLKLKKSAKVLEEMMEARENEEE